MLPIDFIDMMQAQLGAENDLLCKALQGESPVSVRWNDKIGISASTLPIVTSANGLIPWADAGYYLSSRPQFTLDPLLHAGCYYVQEASSMFVEQVLYDYLAPDSVVLDLCAAPGGKATLISQFLGEDGLLVANEVVRQRVFILSENMQKWGNSNTIVTHNKPIEFGERLPNVFDCILVDAPCSGEGMFRKDPNAIAEWSMKNVVICAERQTQILADVWAALKPGGLLIYSTCTFNPEEDENNAQWIADELGADILPITTEKEWGITETTGYHFYPHKVRGEGFYICAFRKHGKASANGYKRLPVAKRKSQAPHRPAKNTAEVKVELEKWLIHPEKWAFDIQERFIQIYPKIYQELIEYIHSTMTCITTGIGMAEVRGKTLAPMHHLAMAKGFRQDTFPKAELPLEKALDYLRGEAIALPEYPIGFLLMTYKNVPLGFVKNIGEHCNNLYPKEWRIRKL